MNTYTFRTPYPTRIVVVEGKTQSEARANAMKKLTTKGVTWASKSTLQCISVMS